MIPCLIFLARKHAKLRIGRRDEDEEEPELSFRARERLDGRKELLTKNFSERRGCCKKDCCLERFAHSSSLSSRTMQWAAAWNTCSIYERHEALIRFFDRYADYSKVETGEPTLWYPSPASCPEGCCFSTCVFRLTQS